MHARDIVERLIDPDPARQHRDIGDEADIGHQVVALAPGIAPEHLEFALIGGEAEDRIQRGGLAGAVGADQAEDAAGLDAQVDAIQRDACAAMSPETFDALLKDVRIVRNAQKILSVQANARFLLDLAAEHGSAAKALADWPDDDYAGLLELLKTRASRLGGESAMRFLRSLGKPSFITSRDVTAALIREGVLARPASGKRDMKAVQAAFNAWAAESGRNLTAISRVLSMSVGV
jgi:3-methyladenine DNA glycosylase Tag